MKSRLFYSWTLVQLNLTEQINTGFYDRGRIHCCSTTIYARFRKYGRIMHARYTQHMKKYSHMCTCDSEFVNPRDAKAFLPLSKASSTMWVHICTKDEGREGETRVVGEGCGKWGFQEGQKGVSDRRFIDFRFPLANHNLYNSTC